MFGLSKIEMILLGAFAAMVIAGGAVAYIFHKGEATGTATVTTAVQSKTIETINKARVNKDAADEAVRNSPYTDNVDSLR